MEYVGTVPRRYVACLDVLGFSRLVEKDLLRLYDAYWSSVQILRRLEESARFAPDNPGIRHLDGTPEPGKMVRDFSHIIDVTVFSDSIFIFTDDESQDSLNELCEFCYQIYDIFLQRGLVLRGGYCGW
jgi:hypothetical protein